MHICIPIEADQGLSSQICLHFSDAPKFMIVDTESHRYKVIEVGGDRTSATSPAETLVGREIDTIVVGGIGIRSLSELNEAGIDVFSTAEDKVEDIIASFEEGVLHRVTLEHPCQSRRGFNGAGGCGGECR